MSTSARRFIKKIMISVARIFRLGIRVAAWATPHVKEWHRQRHLNSTEGLRHLESRNWIEAERYLTSALDERKAGSVKRVELLLGLERAQRHQNKLADAEQTALQAIDLATKGGNRSGRSLAMEAIVDLQLEQNKYAEAEKTINEIQRLEQSRSTPDHALLAKCSRKLAIAFLNSDRQTEAMDAFERAAKLSEQGFGPDHTETANTLAELGGMHRQHGNHAEAQRCIRRALQIHRSKLGADSHEASKDLHLLAASLEESGDLDGAMGEYERVLALSERQVGGNRQEIAETQARLGILYLHAGRPSAARELLSHAIGTLQRKGGQCLADAYEALAVVEEFSGRSVEAEQWREKASNVVTSPA